MKMKPAKKVSRLKVSVQRCLHFKFEWNYVCKIKRETHQVERWCQGKPTSPRNRKIENKYLNVPRQSVLFLRGP